MNYSQKPLLYELRSGTYGDEFVELTESFKIINNQILLSELPDQEQRVEIANYSEVVISDFEDDLITSSQFKVNYLDGRIFFNPSEEGKTVQVKYFGRGLVYIPDSRIYTKVDDNGNVSQTLGNIVDNAKVIFEQLETIPQLIINTNNAKDGAIAATTTMNNTNSAINSAEALRVSAENTRQSNETARGTAENSRASAEIIRQTKENERDTAEGARRLNETTRGTAENSRVSAEGSRVAAENTRQSQEGTRQTQEITRQSNTTNAIQALNDTRNSYLFDKDAYSTTKQYLANNQVHFNGATYICIQDSLGNSPTNTSYWRIFASKGADGLGTVTTLTSTSGDLDIGGTPQVPNISLSADLKNKIQTVDGQSAITQTLVPGQNVVVSDRATPVQVAVQGWTLSNKIPPQTARMLGTVSGGLAEGWLMYGGSELQFSVTTDTSGVKWQRVEIVTTPTASMGFMNGNSLTGGVAVSPGEQVLYVIRVKSSFSAVRVILRDLTNAITFTFSDFPITPNVESVAFLKGTMPAGCNRISVYAASPTSAVQPVGSWIEASFASVYTVNAETYEKIGTDPEYTGAKLAAKFPYVDGTQHIQGLALLHPGRNIFEPFTKKPFASSAFDGSTFTAGPFETQFRTTTANGLGYVVCPVKPNTTYTLVGELANAQMAVYEDVSGNPASIAVYDTTPRTFNSGSRTSVRIYVRTITAGYGSFKNPMLVLGTAANLPPSFEPRQDELWTVNADLSSLPNGLKDRYESRTGNLFKEIEHVVLDGTLAWQHDAGAYTGYKRVRALLPSPSLVSGGEEQVCVKSTGKLLNYNGLAPTAPDQFTVYNPNGNVYISIANLDSGWTDAAAPTSEQIASYFASNPYRIYYKRATPMVRGVITPGLSLHPGPNSIEVISGVIWREKVMPQLYAGYYKIASQYAGNYGLLQYKNTQIMAIYRGMDRDYGWSINNDANAQGRQTAQIIAAEFDPDEEYYVTYQVLDRYTYTALPSNVAIRYEASMGSVVGQNVEDIARLRTHDFVQDAAIDRVEAHNDNVRYGLETHATDNIKHITAAERTAWNAKASTAVATTSANGLMSSTDKTKLITLEAEVETLGSLNAIGIVIAPHDALPSSKAKADIVLTGTGDAAAINAAIGNYTNPLADWGLWKRPVFYFSEGQINVEETIILRSSVDIIGSGNNTVFRLMDNAKCDIFGQDVEAEPTLYHNRLENFFIDGNHANNTNAEYYGIHIYPQEVNIKRLWVYNCYRGLRLYGGGTYGAMIDSCMIQNNYHYGIGLGGDCIMTNCGIGGNAKEPAVEWSWGASGIFLAGWNSQLIANHFADNLIDIFSNWSAYNQIQGCVFEAGIKENIVLEGRAWGWTISNNRFGGRRQAKSDGNTDSIAFRGIDPGEGAWGNIITGNSFTVYETATDIGYRYCVSEVENCNKNLITNNVFEGGFHSVRALKIVGQNTLVTNNIDGQNLSQAACVLNNTRTLTMGGMI